MLLKQENAAKFHCPELAGGKAGTIATIGCAIAIGCAITICG